jgi:putative heme transporter
MVNADPWLAPLRRIREGTLLDGLDSDACSFRQNPQGDVLKTPTTRNDSALVRFEPTPKAIVLILLGVAGAWVCLRLAPVVLVLVAALFLVGTLNPAVEWLEGKGWKRHWGIATVFSVLFVATLVLMALTVPSLVAQVRDVVGEEPALRSRLADFLSGSEATQSLADALRNVRYDTIARSYSSAALDYSTRFLELVAYVASAVFLALYITIDRDRLRGGLFATVPRSHHVRLSRILLNLETIVGGYIRGQVLTSAIMGVFTFVLLAACGVHHALAIGVFAGIADVLPYVGVFLSVGPAAVAALSKGPGVATFVVMAMLAYEEVESRLLVPRIYGSVLRLPSSVVLIALLAGGTLMGIVGALLALPAAAAVKMLVEELRVDLPGEEVVDEGLRKRDEQAEEEYQRRAEGVPAKEAAAIAVEISEERREEEGGEVAAAEVPAPRASATGPTESHSRAAAPNLQRVQR